MVVMAAAGRHRKIRVSKILEGNTRVALSVGFRVMQEIAMERVAIGQI